MELLVECPIHLDAVSISEILVFKCGHGFCERCLEEHFASARYGQTNMSCPTCRKPVRRKDAFPLFLTPAQSSTQAGSSSSGHSVAQASHERVVMELREAKAVHAHCLEQSLELQHEIDTLRRDNALFNQTIQHLQGRYQLLEERLAKEANSFAHAKEQSQRWKEEAAKLAVEKQKAVEDYKRALEWDKAQQERVKQYQGYIDRYKRKCDLEKKKRKAIEVANRHPLPKDEDLSLMVVDANAPDMLHQSESDFKWLNKACKVKGDQFPAPADEDMESEKSENESEDEILLTGSDHSTNGKQKEDQRQGPSVRFRSDWNFEVEGSPGPLSGVAQKQRSGSRRAGPGKSKLFKAKIPSKSYSLAIDSQGHVKGTVALGSRQKFNSKN